MPPLPQHPSFLQLKVTVSLVRILLGSICPLGPSGSQPPLYVSIEVSDDIRRNSG